MKVVRLASGICHRRKAFIASACLVLLSACTPGQCPEANCALISGSDSVQTNKQNSTTTPGVGIESEKNAATESQNTKHKLVDNANRQADTGGTSMAVNTSPTGEQSEKVGRISYDDAVINASVVSTGCTLSEHFKVEHDVRGGICHVTLVRTKPDYCRRAPFMIDIAIEWVRPAECESLMLEFTNPIVDLVRSTSKSSARQLPKD